jgi:hypothetical protein
VRVMESVPAVRVYLEQLGDERAMDTQIWLDDAAFDDAG